MREVVYVGGARTPIGKFLGYISDYSARELGSFAAKGAVEKAGIKPEDVDNVVAGHCLVAGTSGGVAREVQADLGIPWKTPAVTVNQACGSSMRALDIAMQEIQLGRSDCALVFGTESMSNVPYTLRKARRGYRMFDGNDGPYDEMTSSMTCPICKIHMGLTAENVAEKYSITRGEQDELAFMSHQRAAKANKERLHRDEIVPVKVKDRKKGDWMLDYDENVRDDATLESMTKLKAAFKENGTVTAANASGVCDGAAAAVVMSREKAEAMGIKPLAVIKGIATYGVEPEIMGIGPVKAVPAALARAGIKMENVDYFEINEAFAAQILAVQKTLGISMDRLNANGSGISLGHPVGMTGIRLVIALVNEMLRRNYHMGVASLCAGLGPAIATVMEVD